MGLNALWQGLQMAPWRAGLPFRQALTTWKNDRNLMKFQTRNAKSYTWNRIIPYLEQYHPMQKIFARWQLWQNDLRSWWNRSWVSGGLLQHWRFTSYWVAWTRTSPAAKERELDRVHLLDTQEAPSGLLCPPYALPVQRRHWHWQTRRSPEKGH